MDGESVLAADDANIDNDQTLTVQLPAGFGGIMIADVMCQVTQAATLMTAWETNGVQVRVVSLVSGAVTAFVGTQYWTKVGAAALSLNIKPFRAVLMRDDEALSLFFAEVDTNGAPTADLRTFVRGRRLRNLGGGYGFA